MFDLPMINRIISLGFGVGFAPHPSLKHIYLFMSGLHMCLMSMLSFDLTVWSTKHKTIHHELEFLHSSANCKYYFSFYKIPVNMFTKPHVIDTNMITDIEFVHISQTIIDMMQ